MSEKFRQHHKIGFQNMFYTKCNNIINDNIGILISLMVDIDYRFINCLVVYIPEEITHSFKGYMALV